MILVTLIALGVLVTIHEFGHFWVARRCGIKVLRFSIGFGTPLARWTDRQGTEFVIAALPLGGYVKMVDEREEGEVAPEDIPYAFNRKSVWQRIAVVVAGPLANFILAIALFWLVFLAGVKGLAPIVGEITPDSLAAQAGLQVGDEIVAVDGEPTVTTQALREQLIYRIGETGELLLDVRAEGSSAAHPVSIKLDRWLAEAEEIDPVADLGIDFYRPSVPPVADEVVAGSPVEQAGLKSGDRILEADGVVLADWDHWVAYVRARSGKKIDILVLRNTEQLSLSVTPVAATPQKW